MKLTRKLLVTTTEWYVIPDIFDNKTDEQLVQEWFNEDILNETHATRDGYRVGGSKELVSVDVEHYDEDKVIKTRVK